MTVPLQPPPKNLDRLDLASQIRETARWMYEVYRRMKDTGLLSILYTSLDFTGSSLSSIASRAHAQLQSVLGVTVTSTDTSQVKHVSDANGKKWEDGVDASTAHIAASTNVHGVGSGNSVVGTGTSQTLSNKTVPDLQFSLTGPARTPEEGMVFWDTTNKTLAAKLDGPDVTLQIGQEMHVRVVNKTGADIPNGKLVYIAGAQGNRPKIVLAKADADATANVVGMTTELIEDNGNGYVTVFGDVRDLDTSTFTAGDVVYLSAATAGEFTKTVPTFPNYVIEIGHVVVADATAGVITLRPGINVANHVTINALGAKTAKFGTATDYSSFEADGTLVNTGSATTFDDSQAAVIYMRTGGTALTLDVLSGGVYAYRFDSTDEVHSQIQTTHRYKLGSPIGLHIHLINKNAIGATNYNIGVELEWCWAGLNQVMPAATTEATVNCSFQNASALTHKVFELKDITPTAAQNSISSILFFRVKRVTATTQNYAANDIFIAGIDFHNEMDTQGSREEYVK